MSFLALLGFCECDGLNLVPLIDALVCGKRGLSPGEHGAFVAGGPSCSRK